MQAAQPSLHFGRFRACTGVAAVIATSPAIGWSQSKTISAAVGGPQLEIRAVRRIPNVFPLPISCRAADERTVGS